MGVRRIFDLVLGLIVVGGALFSREFRPIGWTTSLIWGKDADARIPRWVGASFYFVLGIFLLYIAITGK
jgi:hypothetical protein